MARVIGILSGKGGVGKTTLVANIGTILSFELNKKVVLIDNNVTAPNLDLHFGLYDEFQYTLRDMLNDRVTSSQAVSVCSSTGVKIIQSPFSKGKKINLKKLKRHIKKLSKTHDILILDFAPALGDEVVHAIDSIDEAIVITTPRIPDVASALKTIKFLKSRKKTILGMVVNRIENKKYELKIDEIKSVCGLPILSVIQEDSRVPHSISKGIPVVLHDRNSKISTKFKMLASRLIGREYFEPGIWERLRSFFSFKKVIIPDFHQEK